MSARKLSERYLQRCRNAALAADPFKYDVVINDLRKIINKLTRHISKIQNEKLIK